MKILSCISIALMALVTSACTDTFLIGRYENNFFWGNTSKAMYAVLCTSGALEKILLDSPLGPDMKNDLYTFNCSAERSGDKIRQIYASMTVNERNDLKNAFKINGFAVNVMAVYDDQCATSGHR